MCAFRKAENQTAKASRTGQKQIKLIMDSSLLLAIISFLLYVCVWIDPCLAMDANNLQDTCPTNTSPRPTIFINGLPCKNPSNITASDFKTSLLSHAGDTDNFLRSSVTGVTAAQFPGLNTLGLSIGRTDLEVDGIVMPHSHPRASEMIFVSKGVVIAGFIDTNNKLFQRVVREGDVFVFPRGLLHYGLNAGFEVATVFAVLNSQNPGMVNIADAMFPDMDLETVKMATKRLITRSTVEEEEEANYIRNTNLFE